MCLFKSVRLVVVSVIFLNIAAVNCATEHEVATDKGVSSPMLYLFRLHKLSSETKHLIEDSDGDIDLIDDGGEEKDHDDTDLSTETSTKVEIDELSSAKKDDLPECILSKAEEYLAWWMNEDGSLKIPVGREMSSKLKAFFQNFHC